MTKKIALIFTLIIFSCGTNKKIPNVNNIDRIDFSSYEKIACKPGITNQEFAKTFEKIYKFNYQKNNFESSLINFLNKNECLNNYYFLGLFLTKSSGYTNIENFDLAEKVLKSGLKRVEYGGNRNELMAKCSLYWNISLLYYRNNQKEKSIKYLKLAKNEEKIKCGMLFPALDENERKEFLNFYDKVTEE